MQVIRDARGWYWKQGRPATLGLVLSLTAAALIFWFTRGRGVDQLWLTPDALERPWTLLTYPWADMPLSGGLSLMFFVFLLLWLYSLGGPVEREMGSARFLVFWFVATAVSGLFFAVGGRMLGVPFALGDAYLPVGAVTMVWCARNMSQTIMLYGILPLSGKQLAVVEAVVVFLLYGQGSFMLGLLACIPQALAFAYGTGKIPGVTVRPAPKKQSAGRGQSMVDKQYFDDVRKREKEREERERLRKLFEGNDKEQS